MCAVTGELGITLVVVRALQLCVAGSWLLPLHMGTPEKVCSSLIGLGTAKV